MRDRTIVVILGMMVVFASLCFNFNILLPVLAKQTLDAGPRTFGVLSAAFGAGALLGALAAAAMARARWRTMLIGATGFARLRAADRARSVGAARRLLLFFCGIFFTSYTANSNARLQLDSPDHLRGRVLSLYYYAWNGLAPLGGLIVGWLSATGGTELAFTVAGTAGLVMATSGALVLRQKKAPRSTRAGRAGRRADRGLAARAAAAGSVPPNVRRTLAAGLIVFGIGVGVARVAREPSPPRSPRRPISTAERDATDAAERTRRSSPTRSPGATRSSPRSSRGASSRAARPRSRGRRRATAEQAGAPATSRSASTRRRRSGRRVRRRAPRLADRRHRLPRPLPRGLRLALDRRAEVGPAGRRRRLRRRGSRQGMDRLRQLARSQFRGRCYLAYVDTIHWQLGIRTSDDGGQTWSKPQRLQPGVTGPGAVFSGPSRSPDRTATSSSPIRSSLR